MTFYGFITVQIQNGYFWLVLFIFQFIPAVYNFVGYLKDFMAFSDLDRALLKDQDSYEGMFVWGYVGCMFLLFWIFSVVKTDIKKGFGRKHGRIFIILGFIIGPFAMIGLSLYTILVSKQKELFLAHEIVLLLTVPTMLLLILTWLYFHFRFLSVPPLHIEKRLKEMEEK